MNKIILIGRLTKDPEVKSTQSGKKVANFSLALNGGKDQQGNMKTEYINCQAWEKTAEVLQNYTSKGSQIAVEGQLKTDGYDNKEGVRVYKTYVLVRVIELLGSKSDNQAQPSPQKTTSPSNEPPEIDLEDINMPF